MTITTVERGISVSYIPCVHVIHVHVHVLPHNAVSYVHTQHTATCTCTRPFLFLSPCFRTPLIHFPSFLHLLPSFPYLPLSLFLSPFSQSSEILTQSSSSSPSVCTRQPVSLSVDLMCCRYFIYSQEEDST